MPKVNTTFFECPNCHCIEFKEETTVFFVKDSSNENIPGPQYAKKLKLKCVSCGKVISEEMQDWVI